MSLPTQGRIRMYELLKLNITGMKRTKLLAEIKAGRFPQPRRDSFRMVTFDCAEIHAWLARQRDHLEVPELHPARGGVPPLGDEGSPECVCVGCACRCTMAP